MNLLEQLQQRFAIALKELVPNPAPFAEMVRAAQNPQHGDYQANCAMSLGKHLGQKPQEIAKRVVAALDRGEMIESAEVAGPGFINLRLRTDWIAEQLQRMATDERLGVERATNPKTYVIDYSSPNVAKPMHVGHLRSTIIGDAIARLLRFLGHKVIGDNHLGDWGTQFGMILWGWKNHRDDAAYRAEPVLELARLYRLAASCIKTYETHGKNLEKVRVLEAQGKAGEAAALYAKLLTPDGPTAPLARDEIERQVQLGQEVDAAARAETVKLHAGDPENRALWKQFMPHCLGAINKIYERLDVHFDEWLGESAYDDMLADVVADLKQQGLAVESQGALIVEVPGTPAPFMVQKSDGAFNYASTDLATIKYRNERFHPDVLLYVVDHRQGDHFKALFDVAKRWGFDKIAMEHIGFGTIMGPDKRPYKTREGDVVGLESLLDEAVARARRVVEENSPDMPAEERQQVAEVVGLGAVKYADLVQNRTSDYVFDWDKMLAMDGNTATYMQYACARNRAIFRKGNEAVAPFRANPPRPMLTMPQERALGLQLLRFQDALEVAAQEYKPNLVTAYLWDLAKTYSGFFENCPVLKAETPELRRSRLLLCDLTARVLQKALDLLGIRTAERM